MAKLILTIRISPETLASIAEHHLRRNEMLPPIASLVALYLEKAISSLRMKGKARDFKSTREALAFLSSLGVDLEGSQRNKRTILSNLRKENLAEDFDAPQPAKVDRAEVLKRVEEALKRMEEDHVGDERRT